MGSHAAGYSLCLATSAPLSTLQSNLAHLLGTNRTDSLVSLDMFRGGRRTTERRLPIREAIARIVTTPFNESLIRPRPQSAGAALRIVPSPNSDSWLKLPSRPTLKGAELLVYLDHATFQTPIALDPEVIVPTFVDVQVGMDAQSEDRQGLKTLLQLLLRLEGLPALRAWVEPIGMGAHPLQILAGFERGLTMLGTRFPKLSHAWLLANSEVNQIMHALEVEAPTRSHVQVSSGGYTLLSPIADLSASGIGESKLAAWIVPRNEITRRRRLDAALGEYELSDGSSVFSLSRSRELEDRGFVVALADGEDLVPVLPPALEAQLGAVSHLIPAVPMHADEHDQFNAALHALLGSRRNNASRSELAEAVGGALASVYGTFGHQYAADLSRIVSSLLLNEDQL